MSPAPFKTGAIEEILGMKLRVTRWFQILPLCAPLRWLNVSVAHLRTLAALAGLERRFWIGSNTFFAVCSSISGRGCKGDRSVMQGEAATREAPTWGRKTMSVFSMSARRGRL